MNRRWTALVTVYLLAVSIMVVAARAAEKAPKEVKVMIDQVPAAVKATIQAEGGKIADIARKAASGKTIYEADIIKDGKEIELQVAEDGKLVSRKIEGDAEEGEKKEEGENEKGNKNEKDSEEVSEAHACVEGAKALAGAKVTMLQAIEVALKEGKGAKPFKADLEMDEGKLLFDIELLDGEKGPEMEIDAVSGKVIKIESVEEQEKEDAADGDKNSKEEQEEAKDKAAAAKALPLAKITLAQAVETAVAQAAGSKAYKVELKPEDGRPRYEVQVVAGDKCMEVVIDGVSRKVIEVEPKGSTTPKDRAAAKEGGWRRSFPVDKANLVPTGKNPYFSIEPGHQASYKDGENTLVITVLNETKVVDGVTTRIVEERETEGGKLAEVSRNFFAIDKTTNDVYYFGEEVDDYKDGKVVSHGGAWLAGEKGAKFGLMMPAKPKVGDRFYQEVAPKVAMDRAEVVSLDKELKTPAGTFKCLYFEETSAIEKGTSYKLYAAGVGLVKDDDFVLVQLPK